MDFGANKTLVEAAKKSIFGWTYFRDIYSGANGKWYRKSWKEFDQLKDIDQKYYCSSCSSIIAQVLFLLVNKCGVKCGTSLRLNS